MNYIIGLLVRAGLCTTKFIAAFLLAAVKILGFIFSEIAGLFRAICRAAAVFLRSATESFRNRVKVSNELIRDIKKARKEGKKEYISAIVKFAGSFVFGEDGIIYTAFNYVMPIVSAAFLIGIISYGSTLEYGIAVEYNGKEIGVITEESDYESAVHDVQQRISYSAGDNSFDLSAKLSLRIISDGDRFINPAKLADAILEASDAALSEAVGIYINDVFEGAVNDRQPVQDALDKNLLDYKPDGIVREVTYADKIEYRKGIYLTESIQKEEDIAKKLTSTKESKKSYVALHGETILDVVQKFAMTIDDFYQLNPKVDGEIKEGQILNVVETSRYLPIRYVRELETLTFLDYETVEVETSSLNVGRRAMLVKGERGEKLSNIEIVYIDGIEQSRTVLSSEILKNPVVETIGVGTYSAQPDDPETVYFGYPITGTGQMGWPVNGGWVSDGFISDRNHKGLDIAAPEGSEIYASEEGYVVSAGWNSGGYGNVVMIEHPDGYATVYAHMIQVYAYEGEYVTKGQLIGFVGSTGNSTGNHCHFEVRYQGICLDPTAFLNTTADYYRREEE